MEWRKTEERTTTTKTIINLCYVKSINKWSNQQQQLRQFSLNWTFNVAFIWRLQIKHYITRVLILLFFLMIKYFKFYFHVISFCVAIMQCGFYLTSWNACSFSRFFSRTIIHLMHVSVIDFLDGKHKLED